MLRSKSGAIAGWSKKLSSKAEASEEAKRTWGPDGELLSDAKTTLAVFSNILLGRNVWAR